MTEAFSAADDRPNNLPPKPTTPLAVNDTSNHPSSLFGGDKDQSWADGKDLPLGQGLDSIPASRMTQWPSFAKTDNSKHARGSHISIQSNPRDNFRRYSVEQPVSEKSTRRPRQQNAKAGIKVITDLPKHRRASSRIQGVTIMEAPKHIQAATFVDLAALQALNNNPPNNNPGFWKSMKGIIPSRSDVAIDDASPLGQADLKSTANEIDSRVKNQRGKGLVPSPIRLENELSPSDRPIVIGISIPSARLEEHTASPTTDVSDANVAAFRGQQEQSPGADTLQTPTIVITPAQVPSKWSLSTNAARPTSSVYSRTTNSFRITQSTDVPPLPNMPPSTLKAHQQEQGETREQARDSLDTVFDEDMTPQTASGPRIMSSLTVFEEDTLPIISPQVRTPSSIKHTSLRIATDMRRSRGWWNLILTPFLLTRSNTLGSPRSIISRDQPEPFDLEIANDMERGQSHSQHNWEKTHSPMTPQTSTTIASDAWWDQRNTLDGLAKQAEPQGTATPTGYDDQSGTLPFVLLPSASVINRSRMAAIERSDAGGTQDRAHQSLQQDTPTGTQLSTSDREAPVILDVSSLHASNVVSHNPAGPPSRFDNLDRSAVPRQLPSTTNAIYTLGTETTITVHNAQGSNVRQPPPYSPPQAYIPRYRAVFPPGHHTNLREPSSPGPFSPGLQQAMTTRGGIAMSEVPLTPASRKTVNLKNSGYSQDLSFPPPPTTKAKKAEAKRRRHEKEDAIAHQANSLWKGRGCFPDRGYGRGGPEGRKRRRWYCGLITGFSCMIILIVVLATQLHHNPSEQSEPSQWINLTDFPPMFTGISTVAAPENTIANTGCVFPATMWSCDLPKELQRSGSQPDQPSFRFNIQWDNSTKANATFANVTGDSKLQTRSALGQVVTARELVKRFVHITRRALVFSSSPSPPTYAEQFFLGNTTDSIVSDNKAGEPTPFYISLLSTTSGLGSIASTLKRDSNSTSPFPDISSFIPAPEVNPNGTAAAANLLPHPFQQPIRLYDRGFKTEHYGFYTYFNRSIFLKSTALLNESNTSVGEIPDDENGGSTEEAALFRCTWAQTRLLIQMWTRQGNSSALLNAASRINLLDSASNYTAAIANDFTRPGSFPYPITITTDRHGGDENEKLLYCYELNAREEPIVSSAKVWSENRGFGGTLINPAPNVFGNDSDPSLGGFDGGSGGCKCVWENWQKQ